jgi:hypothetical protein
MVYEWLVLEQVSVSDTSAAAAAVLWCPALLFVATEGIRANGRSADIIDTLLQAAFPEFFPEGDPC